jgi:riboflavin synthase
MFTGLVEQVGKVESAEDRRGQRKIHVQTKWTDLKAGESVSVNGVCLTVAEAGNKGEAVFFVSEETLERSNLGKLEAGIRVNMERAMQFGGRMGGHWVQGHVDAKGMVLNNVEGADHHRITVALDPKYGKYCVEKGSIAIDGVSLTINAITETRNKEFMVSFLVIPHTWKHTTISDLKTGDAVNVEVDILAKYIERLCPQQYRELWNN